MTDLRLVIFDVDGTLVDSEADIYGAMVLAFATIGASCPTRGEVRSIIGMSLDQAFARLVPDLFVSDGAALLRGYKEAYGDMRQTKGAAETSPLFPGARDAIAALQANPFTMLAVATGKSQRGLDKLIEAHGLDGIFVSRQVADHHPSKPHPSMILACLRETGVSPHRAIMVGDTSFDIDMARAAGTGAIAVSWGYHPAETLAADVVIDSFAALPPALEAVWARA